MKTLKLLGVAVMVLIAVELRSSAGVISSQLVATTSAIGPTYFGTSFTTDNNVGAGPFEDIKFNWFSSDSMGVAINPYAVGRLFILSSALPEYTGTPNAISSATYIASALANNTGTAYEFAHAVQLAANTTYYAYLDGTAPAFTLAINAPVGSHAETVTFGDPNSNYNSLSSIIGNLAYNVEGTQAAAVPEPSTLVLLSLAVVGLSGYGRRRKRNCVQRTK